MPGGPRPRGHPPSHPDVPSHLPEFLSAPLPLHSLLTPESGNAFRVRLFPSSSADEEETMACDETGDEAGRGDDAHRASTPLAPAADLAYLSSDAPPPVAPPPIVAPPPVAPIGVEGGAVAVSFGSRSLLPFSFGGASIVSDSDDFVHLSDLDGMADAALAAMSANNKEAERAAGGVHGGLVGGNETPTMLPSEPDICAEADTAEAEACVRTAIAGCGVGVPTPQPLRAPSPSLSLSGGGCVPVEACLLPESLSCQLSRLPSTYDPMLPPVLPPDHHPVPPGSGCGTSAPPPLMALPSWSRAPSFSFADS